MDKFLLEKDELSIKIQEQAAKLYTKLKSFSIDELDIPYYCKEYYKGSHSRRLFFSIQTSAHLLYRSIRLNKKPPGELVVMDYGAGIGSLFLLAKMIGCHVVYNDHLSDWKKSARAIAERISINIDHFIVGDISETLQQLETLNIRCDIILSRNVIEHIYKLDLFYNLVHAKQPKAIVFSSTTANFLNPASRVKHVLWHQKWEKQFIEKRKEIIRSQTNALNEEDIIKLAENTRGLALSELDHAIRKYANEKTMPDPSVFRTNTCDPETGVWFENMLSPVQYLRLIDPTKYDVRFEPGFWDTHYNAAAKNLLGQSMNSLMRMGRKTALSLAPFIYVIAIPKESESL